MTKDQFLLYWKLLCERYNRAPSAPLERLYALTIQGAGLTHEEWAQAVAAAVRFDDFFPSAQRLIDYARPSFKVQALTEWDDCVERVRRGEAATLPNTFTRTLMNRVTNGKPLGQMDEDRLPFLKREFLERFVDHLTTEAQAGTPALLPTSKREALPDAS